MRYALLLLVLIPLLSQGAVSRGTTSSCVTSTALQTSCDITHTVDAGTTLLILVVSVEGNESVDATPTWNTSENFTLVNQTTASGNNADVTNYVYALVNPTVDTDNTVTVSVTQTDNISAFAINYLGTEKASVAAATNALNDVVNNDTAETNTTELASGGASGNTLLVTGAFKGGDGDPASNASEFTELFDGATGTDVTTDHAYYVADKIAGAPSAVTITWATTDSNAGQLVEIVAASSVLFYVR